MRFNKEQLPEDVVYNNDIEVKHTKTVATAGQIISALRILTTDGLYADKDILAHSGKVAGLSISSGAIGEPITIITSGEFEDNSWNWTVGNPVYLSNDGYLTQDTPTTGFIMVVGYPITDKKLLIRLGISIVL